MTDKETLMVDVINMIQSRVSAEDVQDIKMAMTIILEPYHVERHGTDITIYEGDKNNQIMKKFIASKIAAGLSLRTIDYYRNTLEFYFNYTGAEFDKVTPDDVRLYLAMRVQKDKVSKTTANNERRVLSSFYGWLQREEILIRNPMAKVDTIKETKRKKQAYELMDLEKIRLGCRTARERAMVEFLASTWCRVSEMVNVRIDEISDGKVIVRGKGDKYREVYLNDRAKLCMEIYLKERKDLNPYLFPRMKYAGDVKTLQAAGLSRPSRMPDWYKDPSLVDDTLSIDAGTVEAIIRKLGKRVGVKNCHPHRFRRTGATLALRSGMPITTVQKLLGHNNIETTQIYLDISDDELEQAHKKYVI